MWKGIFNEFIDALILSKKAHLNVTNKDIMVYIR